YTYSEERGSDFDGEENEALYSRTPKGDTRLVQHERIDKKSQYEDDFDLDEDDGAKEGK
nr:lung seven transmembrane receptor family protein [Tanacetum cinerariifolium]